MIEVDYQSVNCYGESLCGDSFLREDVGKRTIIVHSDGMGHGPKANVLSELTCEIVMSEYMGKKSITRVVETLASRLPLCSVRGIGYSTFTLIDVNKLSNKTIIVEYDNPPTLIFRGNEPLIVDWDVIDIEYKGQTKELLISEVTLKEGDTIVVCSDGVTQSGLGTDSMPKGWGSTALGHFIEKIISLRSSSTLTATELAARVVEKAVENEKYYPRDDISCTAIRIMNN